MSEPAQEPKQEQPDSSQPVLEISTISPKRPKVKIRTKAQPDGKLCELRVRSEFSARAWFSLQAKLEEHDGLAKKGRKLDEAEIDRLDELAGDMIDAVLIAFDTARNGLTYTQRMDVVGTFQLLQYATPNGLQALETLIRSANVQDSEQDEDAGETETPSTTAS